MLEGKGRNNDVTPPFIPTTGKDYNEKSDCNFDLLVCLGYP